MSDKVDLSEEISKAKKLLEENENKFLESWGVTAIEKISAGLAYKGFSEKEKRDGQFNFYGTPLARKSFMIGWILAGRSNQVIKGDL